MERMLLWPVVRNTPLLLLPAPHDCVRSAHLSAVSTGRTVPHGAGHDHSQKVPVLPDDVARLVLERLRAARDVAAARSVCRQWRIIVDTSKIIWKTLVFDAVPRSHSSAAMYYRKAAANGNQRAAFLLALLYSYGWRPHATDSRGNLIFAATT